MVSIYYYRFSVRLMAGEDEKQCATHLNRYAAEAGIAFTEDALI
jgi:hypothetical protein